MNQNHAWVRRQTAVLLSATLALSPVLAVPAFAAEGGSDKPAAAASAEPIEGEKDTLNVEVPEGDQPATDPGQQPAEDEKDVPVPAATEAAPAAEGDSADGGEATAGEPKAEAATTQADVDAATDKLVLHGTITGNLTINKKLDITAADDTVVKGKITINADYVTIDGVHFSIEGASYTGPSISNTNHSNLTVKNCHFESDGKTGSQLNIIWIQGNADNIKVENNNFAMSLSNVGGSHVGVNLVGPGIDNFELAGNTLNVLPAQGTPAGNLYLLIANGNMMQGEDGYGITGLYARGNTVTNKTGLDSQNSRINALGFSNVNGVTISGNKLDGAMAIPYTGWKNQDGKEEGPSTNVLIENNKIDSYYGIILRPQDLTEGGLTVKPTNTFTGVFKYANDGTVWSDPNGVVYSSAQAAIDAGVTDITLLRNFKQDVVIPSDKTIVLDLNGHTLTNKSAHTITNNGTLTVKDSVGGGVVDNVSHGKGALENTGTATIEGGTFTRSKEASTSTTDNGGNSWYVLDNNGGTLTVKSGVVKNTSKMSSLVRNLNGTMTVNGGEFSNDFIALKNDDGGKLIINGGTVSSQEQAVQNWREATINGGVLNGKVIGWAYTGQASSTTVAGGTINGDVMAVNYQNSKDLPSVSVTGGTIKGEVKKGTHDGKTGIVPVDPTSDVSNISVSGGSFSTEPDPAYVVPGSGFGQNADGTWGVIDAKVVVADTNLVKDNVYTYDVRDGKEITAEDLLELVKVNVDGYTATVNQSNLPALNVAIGAKNTDKSFEFTFGATKDGAAADAEQAAPLTIAVKLVDSTPKPDPEPTPEPTPDTHKVTFVWGGSADSVIAEVEDGKQVTAPTEAPTLDGHTFTGRWYLTRDPKTGEVSGEYDFSKPVTEDVTLYAGWLANGSGTPVDPERPATPEQPAKPSTPDNGGTKPAGTTTPTDAKEPGVPDTGDRTSAAVPAALAAAGIAAAAGAVAFRRRNEN